MEKHYEDKNLNYIAVKYVKKLIRNIVLNKYSNYWKKYFLNPLCGFIYLFIIFITVLFCRYAVLKEMEHQLHSMVLFICKKCL